jgi:flagellar biosynthesis/type III secretory pathway chaperone
MDINDIVNTHIEVLSELNTLLDYEKEVLIKDEANELSNIIEKKKLITQKIAFVEKKRQEIYGAKTAQELASEGVIKNGQVDKLKKLTEDIKEKNDTNLILTRQSIYYIRMITSALNPNQRVVTYGNNGSIDDATSRSVFNRKI